MSKSPAFPSVRPLTLYLLATGSWFAALGVQTVFFTWLVTLALHESPDKVGLAQFTMMLPTLALILWAGVAADRLGGARLATWAQSLSLLPVLGLLTLLAQDALSYGGVLVYALAMGVVQAFLTPARDGLLAQLAGDRLQRAVVQVSLVQFGVQLLGFLVAGLTDALGPLGVLSLQGLFLAFGALCFGALRRRLPKVKASAQSAEPLSQGLRAGIRTVLAVPALRTVVFMNLAVGLLFMGSFQVGIPLLVRDVFNAGAAELAAVNAVHVVGAVVTMVSLLRYGDVLHPGRLLLLGVLLGVGGLSGMGLAPSFGWVLFFNFCWGVTGGMVMAMARALMQEGAPEGQRGRVMAFFTLTFMGAGPLGALLSGYLVESLGPRLALLTPAGLMLLVILAVMARSPLWAYRRGVVPAGA